jgi:recombination protein RecR
LFEGPVQDLIDALRRLPGIGAKTAQRLAFHLLRANADEAMGLADAIRAAKERVAICSECFNVSEGERCRYCRDTRRDGTLICVVEEPADIIAVERTQEFRGRYHVLGGHISPMDGVGPDDLHIRELLERIGRGEAKEIILATNPTVEGEATAIYLANTLKPLGLRVTRIASGLPVGGDLEYADEVTLGRALEGRREV